MRYIAYKILAVFFKIAQPLNFSNFVFGPVFYIGFNFADNVFAFFDIKFAAFDWNVADCFVNWRDFIAYQIIENVENGYI